MQNRTDQGFSNVLKAATMALVLTALFGITASHANVTLANKPLFLTTNVEPNIVFTLDDSGSMQWETMPDELTNIFNQGCCNNYMMWTFPRVTGLHGGGDYGGTRVPSFNPNHIMARAYRSSMVNTVYYNPAVTYRPWANADNTQMLPANPSAAPNRPGFPGFGTRNLTANNTQTANWVDNRVNAATNQSRSFYPAVYSSYVGPPIANVQAAILNATSPLWTLANYNWTEIQATTTTYTGEGRAARTDCASAPVCTYAEEIQNFANWYSYHRNRIFTSRGGIGQAFRDFGPEMRVGFGAINTTNFSVDNVSGTTVRRGVRAFEGVAKTNFYSDLYNLAIPPQGTPLRRALDGAGQYFSRSDVRGPWSDTPGVATTGETSADHLTCRQSFSILMTDGYTSGTNTNAALDADRRANTDGTTAQNTTNVHPTSPAMNFTYVPSNPFQDNRSNTLADVAMYYWKRDLRPTLANEVPSSDRNPAFWQHMVTYGVGLGVGGTVDPATAFAAIPCPACDPPVAGAAVAWPDPDFGQTNCNATTGSCAARVDDLLHATVNSRGGFFSASDPDTFADELAIVLQDIIARVETSGTAAATSSAVLQTDTLLYTASFRSTDWSGTLEAREVDATSGAPGAVKWDAEQKMNSAAPSSRKIFSLEDSGAKIPLLWGNLGTLQQAALNQNPSAVATTANGTDRIAWLRGTEHADLRDRSGGGIIRRIGDLVNSDPQFMFKRDFGYSLLDGTEGAAYKTFRNASAYKDRPDVLFVASNGGMLHAFHAGTPFIVDPLDPDATIMDPAGGDELFAYVPSELLLPGISGVHAQINELMDPAYDHRYFVDGTPIISDAYLSGSWKSVLVGTMGAGGRTVFALDVTNPSAFDENDVLWEFGYSNADCLPGVTACREVGYGITQPTIARLSNGSWVAIFGNGYNSASNKAQLFVVNLANGQLVATIDTGVGTAGTPNGLGPAVATDWPNSDLNATRAYAADLYGNLWRFNLEASPPAAARLFSATDALNVAQPITTRPSIAARPGSSGQIVVAFGTGSFFRAGDDDMTSPQVHSMYGVFDSASGVANITRAQLTTQVITTNASAVTVGTETYGPGALRFVSSNTVGNFGWVLDLPVAGERVISEATFPSGTPQQRVRFTTLIPDPDPCGSGRDGFLMDFALASGGSPSASVFDLSGDGVVDAGDLISGAVAIGIGGTTGERITVIRNADAPLDYLYSGDGTKVIDGLNEAGPIGRQSWRQLR